MDRTAKKFIIGLGADILGSLSLAAGIYCFARRVDIAPGGLSGISLMINHVCGLPVGLITFIMNIPILIIAYKLIGREFTLRTLRTIVISTIMIDVVAPAVFPQYSGDRLLGSIFAGIFMGAGLGVIFMNGSTTAGTDIISYLIEQKFPHIQIGKALLGVDGVILFSSALVFGNFESVLFGTVALFCQMKLINGLVYGVDKGRQVMVMSEKNNVIAKRIMHEIHRGSTLLHASGAYSGKERDMLLCVVRPQEYHRIRDIINEEDPSAFIIVSEADRIMGEGFASVNDRTRNSKNK